MTIQTVLKAPMGGDVRNKNRMRFLLLDRPRSFGIEAAEEVRLIDAGAGTAVSVAVTVPSPLHDYQTRLLMAKESFHHQGVHMHAKVIMADPLGDRPTIEGGRTRPRDHTKAVRRHRGRGSGKPFFVRWTRGLRRTPHARPRAVQPGGPRLNG